MSIKESVQADMKSAMKAGEKDRLRVIRMILAAIKQQEVDQRAELEDSAVLAVLTKMVKQRRDSVKQFRQGKRNDLAEIEESEIAVLETYLPTPLSDAEIESIIDEAMTATGASSIRDMGKVMGLVKQQAEGRADLGAVSARVKARLG